MFLVDDVMPALSVLEWQITMRYGASLPDWSESLNLGITRSYSVFF